MAGRQLRLHFAVFDDAVEALARSGGAWGVLLRQPCQTVDDVRAKAACLLHSYEQMGWAVDAEEVVALLTSFSVGA